jgi:hypothetical protein
LLRIVANVGVAPGSTTGSLAKPVATVGAASVVVVVEGLVVVVVGGFVVVVVEGLVVVVVVVVVAAAGCDGDATAVAVVTTGFTALNAVVTAGDDVVVLALEKLTVVASWL